MRVVVFCHSLLSDWNHGNAHFLRGVVRELKQRGHAVDVFEPRNGWSLSNLQADLGEAATESFYRIFPELRSYFYEPAMLDLDAALEGVDLVLVHEWTDRTMVGRLADHRRRRGNYRLVFHDTHHRSVSAPLTLPLDAFAQFDGVLAFGEAIRRIYLERRWVRRVWTWHEAADTALFRPLPRSSCGDLVWIGNWGDDERTGEIEEYLLAPVEALRLKATVYGVRYPASARTQLARARISYGGYLPNARVPGTFAGYCVTVHVPRRPYVQMLPGIPTIRVFEALACGIPLVSAYWNDVEGLFSPGQDFLVAGNGAEMQRCLSMVLNEPEFARSLAEHGLRTIRRRHTCRHRVDELLTICDELGIARSEGSAACAMG